jgi:D-amino-acid oxidase
MKIGIVGKGSFGKKIHDVVKNQHQIAFFAGRELFTSQNIDLDVDWVIIASSNDSHYELVKYFLNKGKNVFCEKPLVTKFHQVHELYALAEKNGVKLYVDDVFLYNSEYIKNREKLKACKELTFVWNKYGTFNDSITNNLIYHDLYMLIDLFGYPHVESVSLPRSSVNRINEQSFSMRFRNVEVNLKYNRLHKGNYEKYIESDGKLICDFTKNTNNPLSDMFEAVFTNSLDFKRNSQLTFSTQLLLQNTFRNHKPKLAVVGGGIFGVTAALELKNHFNVSVHEERYGFLQNASSINQYRLHRGYHYPRSKETTDSTKSGNKSFLESYDCLNTEEIDNFYCIAKSGSKTSAKDYLKFLESTGLEYKEDVLPLVKSENLDLVVRVKESLFDPKKLGQEVMRKIDENEIYSIFGRKFTREMIADYDYVINCTYSNVNFLLSPEQQFDCQFELCEKLVVKLPEQYIGKSVVIMDGPFMCLDPYGSTGNHVMGNVVHAIHHTNVGKFPEIPDGYKDLLNRGVIDAKDIAKVTKFDKFISSAKEFFHDIEKTEHIGSMFTVRTVLPMKDDDDARPSLIKVNDKKLYTLFSGKIATCVDCSKDLKEILLKT